MSGAVTDPPGIEAHPADPRPAPACLTASIGGVSVAAVHEPRATVSFARERALSFVCDALEAADVECFLVPGPWDQPPRVGVLEQQRPAVLRALREAAAGRIIYAWLDGQPVPVSQLPDTGVRVLQLFELWVWPASEFRLDHRDGVTLELWSSPAGDERPESAGWFVEVADSPGSWHAPVVNHVAPVLPPSARAAARVGYGGRDYPTLSGLAERHVDQVSFDIDVVYTWVDGADPGWRAQRDEWLRDGSRAHVRSATDSGRFRDNDELRFSLRALDQFMPWVRRVHVVTADQAPAWLDLAHPRLRLVSHREILPAHCLPTFNSHALEARLHHIEGLSEHYLYFNDDVLAARPLDPGRFFLGNGLTRFFPTRARFIDPGPVNELDRPVAVAAKNSRDLLRAAFGVTFSRTMKHAPHPQSRQLLLEIEQRFAAELARTTASRFRGFGDLSLATVLHHYYGYATGRSVPSDLAYGYRTLDADDLEPWLRGQVKRKNDAFCVNEPLHTQASAEHDAARAKALLQELLPAPSSFELG